MIDSLDMAIIIQLVFLVLYCLMTLCQGQEITSGSYLYLNKSAKKGTTIGTVTTDMSGVSISIESATYYQDATTAPVSVQDPKWRNTLQNPGNQTDCEESERHPYPRNLFCVQFSTGALFTTSNYESMIPRGGSSFVLGLFVQKGGKSVFSSNPTIVIRIRQACQESESVYSSLNGTCNTNNRVVRTARILNGRFSFPVGDTRTRLVGLDLFLLKLNNQTLKVGETLKFNLRAIGEISASREFQRYLLVNGTQENSVRYRLSSPFMLQFVASLELTLMDSNNNTLLGSTSTFAIHFIEDRSFCGEEQCLVPYTAWINLKINQDNSECITFTDNEWLIPKYNICISNQPPVASKTSLVTINIPSTVGSTVTSLSVVDPERTKLNYVIVSVTHKTSNGSSKSSSSAACVSQSSSPLCSYFNVDASGMLRIQSKLPDKHGDEFNVIIRVTDSGQISRSVTIVQNITTLDKCIDIRGLYSAMTNAICLPPQGAISTSGPTSNVTVRKFVHRGTLDKVIEGRMNITGLRISSSENQTIILIINIRSVTSAPPSTVLRAKNVTQSIEKGQTVYNLLFDFGVDRNRNLEIRIYQLTANGFANILVLESNTISLFPYRYNLYCNNVACTTTYQNWRNTLKMLAGRGVKGCDTDPRFVNAHYQDCFDPPRIIKHPNPSTVTKNRRIVNIICDYFSVTTATVSWLKDGSPFDPPPLEQPQRRKRNIVIGLNFRVSPPNQGRFQCVVTSRFHNVTSNEGLVRLSDVMTSRFSMRITNRPFHIDFANTSSTRYRNLVLDLTSELQRKFQFNGSTPQVVINSIASGSIVVDVSLFIQGPENEGDRRNNCSALLRSVSDSQFGSFTVDKSRSTFTIFDCCPSSQTGTASLKGVITWPISPANAAKMLICPYPNQGTGIFGNATRRCLYQYGKSAQWENPMIDSCAFLSATTGELERLANTPINDGNVKTVTNNLAEKTADPSNITSTLDVQFAAQTIENALRVMSTARRVTTNIIETVSNIMNANEAIVARGQLEFNSSARFLRALQTAGSIVNLQSTTGSLLRSSSNIAMFATKASVVPPVGLSVAATLAQSDGIPVINKLLSPLSSKVVASINLPREVFQKAGKERLTFFFFKNSVLFATNETVQDAATNSNRKKTSMVNSFILDAAFATSKLTSLSQKVVSRFKPLDTAAKGSLKCVFWDFLAAGGRGDWSSRGCSKVEIEQGMYKCSCNHLTHFAVLLDLQGPGQPPTISEADKKALSIISYIGCAISLAGLFLTFLTFALFKNLRKKTPPRILMCLCVSLAAILIIFVAGIEQTSPRVGCHVVAIGLHYFVLSTFFWMAVEAYNLYRCFVIVIGSHMSMFLRKMSLIAWGIPLVIVVVTAGARIDDYGNEFNCMLTGLPFYIALAAPVGILLLTNIIIFVVVLRAVNKDKGIGKDKELDTLAKARIGLACSVLLGLTWAIAFLAVEDLRLPLQYAFCILNSLQGFFIFLFYCLRNTDAMREWKKLCCKRDKEQTSSHAGRSNDTAGKHSRVPYKQKQSIPTGSSHIDSFPLRMQNLRDAPESQRSFEYKNSNVDTNANA